MQENRRQSRLDVLQMSTTNNKNKIYFYGKSYARNGWQRQFDVLQMSTTNNHQKTYMYVE